MGKLGEWAKNNSKFIKLKDGDSVTGTFDAYEPSKFKGQPIIEYTIGGKILSSGSGKLATKMDTVPVGAKVKITRHGEEYDTDYDVEILEAEA